MQIQHLIGRMRARGSALLARQPTWGSILLFGLTTLAFVLVTISPAMRATNGKWNSWADWRAALAAGWVALVAAAYLKISERTKRTIWWTRAQRRRRTQRKLITSKALRKLKEHVNSAQLDPLKCKEIREGLLKGACLSVEAILNLDGQEISASLLDFSASDMSKMLVAARSHREREHDHEHDRDKLVASSAIKEGRLVVVHDVLADPRWESNPTKKYRTVAAIPVTHAGKAFGAISLDSEMPYAFYGHQDDVAIQVEPYAVAVALTYGPDAKFEQCGYYADRNR